MHRDQWPLRAQSASEHVPALLLDVDQMLDEFTRLPLQARFRFDPALPAVITVEFLPERGPSLVWRIGRELLHEGLTEMSGIGEVRMWPTLPGGPPSSWLLLESPEVEALFELPTERLADWLAATYLIASAEAELDGLNWDGFLRDLLDAPEPPPE
ncbi:SsgA family sporulation/cell division regulator [Streptomyces sp. VRA16 Mangrove soil]|uniref:SsgA family sporulation/cell division regulator n=1 Tax=Streptomyces sp. VRA16 Mangrove soil TaxID=2817434 RepID=UPI001A9D0D99|nr:SsgA family sporulation/cell division regulator [Streptomyces sp. VRA16 Mangrove soil]MBO1329995.1 SsgA family sporulation/cell division regulator [Streptomyces sp. VRA16 Mangrove soil]